MDSPLPENSNATRDLPLDLIDPSATNPRKTFDEAGLRELGASLASPVGQIHPILVRPAGDRYELVAGERRWRAAGLAGLSTIRAEVRDIPDDVVREMQLVENAGREDVHPLEEALALDSLVREHGRSPQYLADRLGRPVRWVQRRVALLGLTEDARAWLRDGRLPIAHAQQLAAVDPATQGRVLSRYTGPYASGLPSSRDFARTIGCELHDLDAAPFDPADPKLPGHGPCAKCVHRSDTQADLFGGAQGGALCLDASCWDGKVAATWDRAVKAAPKRHLTVISEPKDVFSYGSEPRWDCELQKTPASEGAKPVALARTQSGHVVELYAKAPKGAAAGDGGDDEETEDGRHAASAARDSAWEAKRAAEAAADRARLEKLLALAATKDGVTLLLRTSLLWVALEYGGQFRQTLVAAGMPAELLELSDEAKVGSLPAEDLLPVLLACMASERIDAIEDQFAEPDEAASFEAELIELMKGDLAPAAEALTKVERINGLAAGDRITYGTYAGGAPFEVEVMSVDVEGFVWRTVEADPLQRQEGEASWEEAEHVEGNRWRDRTFGGPDDEPAVTTELRVYRGAWLQHRSGLRDTAKAPLHKQWLPDGDDRVARVDRGDAVVAQVLDYCRAHKVPLQVNGKALLEELAAAPVPAKKSRGAKAVAP